MDTPITQSEREVYKFRADAFDGKDQRIRFRFNSVQKRLPSKFNGYTQKQIADFERIHAEIR